MKTEHAMFHLLVQRHDLVKELCKELRNYLKDYEAIQKIEEQINNIDNLLKTII